MFQQFGRTISIEKNGKFINNDDDSLELGEYFALVAKVKKKTTLN
jgi:hypothetical protein